MSNALGMIETKGLSRGNRSSRRYDEGSKRIVSRKSSSGRRINHCHGTR